MAKILVGDELINDHGTVVTVGEELDDNQLRAVRTFGLGANAEPNTIPLNMVDEFLEAGYRKLKADEEKPLQAWQTGA